MMGGEAGPARAQESGTSRPGAPASILNVEEEAARHLLILKTADTRVHPTTRRATVGHDGVVIGPAQTPGCSPGAFAALNAPSG